METKNEKFEVAALWLIAATIVAVGMFVYFAITTNMPCAMYSFYTAGVLGWAALLTSPDARKIVLTLIAFPIIIVGAICSWAKETYEDWRWRHY